MSAAPSAEAYLLHLLRRADLSRALARRRQPAAVELRTLELWRAIIGECLASFVYVFLVCGSHVLWPLHSVNTLTKSFSAGLAMATAAHAFGHISGAHANPALTLSALVARRITPLRALFYSTAQCGGAIAGAALLYGVAAPGVIGGGGGGGIGGSLGCTLVADSLSPWQAAALELALSFVVGLTLFASADPERKSMGSDALALGIAYLVCSLVALPATGASMNPARSLGPAFVMNTWTHHWVYWLGPCTGAVLAGLIYEYIFESPPRKVVKEEMDAREPVDLRDDSDTKSSVGLPASRPAQVHQAPPPCFRGGEGLPHCKGRTPSGKYAPIQQQSYYSSLPRVTNNNNQYQTWSSSEYGSSQQFKF